MAKKIVHDTNINYEALHAKALKSSKVRLCDEFSSVLKRRVIKRLGSIKGWEDSLTWETLIRTRFQNKAQKDRGLFTRNELLDMAVMLMMLWNIKDDLFDDDGIPVT